MSLLRRSASRQNNGSGTQRNAKTLAAGKGTVVIRKKLKTSLTTSSPTHSSSVNPSDSELTPDDEEDEDERDEEDESDLDQTDEEDAVDSASSELEPDTSVPYRKQTKRTVSGKPLPINTRRTALTLGNPNTKRDPLQQHVRILTPNPPNRSSSELSSTSCLDLTRRSSHRKTASSASLTDAFASTSLRSSGNTGLKRSTSATQLERPSTAKMPFKSILDVRKRKATQSAIPESPARSLTVRSKVADTMRDMLPFRSKKRKRPMSSSTEEDVEVASTPSDDEVSSNSTQADEDSVLNVRSRDMDVSDAGDGPIELGDEYYLHHALVSELQRLRKDHLISLLHQLLEDYPDSATAARHQSTVVPDLPKVDLVDAIVSFRSDLADASDQSRLENDGEADSGESKQSSKGSRKSSSNNSSSKGKGQARPMTRSISLPSVTLEEEDLGIKRAGANSGNSVRKHTRSMSLAENRSASSSRSKRQPVNRLQVRRSSGQSDLIEEEDEEEDAQSPTLARLGTPIARRTRSAVRTSSDLGRSQEQSPCEAVCDHDSEPEHASSKHHSEKEEETQVRVLRSGKHVPLDVDIDIDEHLAADRSIEEPSETEENSVSECTEDEEDAMSLDDGNDSEQIDLSSATETSLLKLRRDDLVALCDARDLAATGTKKDLAGRLLEWQANAESSSDDEADTSFQPSDSMEDTSFVTENASDDDRDDAETEVEADSPKTPIAKKTLRRSKKSETKTQALANVDEAAPRDRSGRKPLLLDSNRPERQSRPVAHEAVTSSRAQSEAEIVELDLESLNLQDKAIAPDQIKRGEKIGSGGFKDVYTGRFRNVKVAVADIRSQLTENEIKELGLMRDLRHENIVKLIGVVKYDEPTDIPCSLVTELCLNGDLFDYIRRDAPAPPFEKILKIMLDIASGLDYLHNRTPKIIHRDMKSSNVLITARGVAKLTDFGLARVKNSTRSMIKSLVGTVNWQAPELWVPHPRYNEKVDCYAAGMVFWECLQWHQPVKKYPFEGMNEHAIYQEVGHKHLRPSTAGMGRHWGAEIMDLVDFMWAQSPADRPGMADVVKDLTKMISVAKKAI